MTKKQLAKINEVLLKKKVTSLTTLSSAIAVLEGGKKQARVGEVREILKLLTQIHAAFITNGSFDPNEAWPLTLLYRNAEKLSGKLTKGKKQNVKLSNLRTKKVV